MKFAESSGAGGTWANKDFLEKYITTLFFYPIDWYLK